MGHNLPIAVMPSRQQLQRPTMRQIRADTNVHTTYTNAPTETRSAVQPTAAHTLPPMPPLMRYLYANPGNVAPKIMSSRPQEWGGGKPPPLTPIMPYAPTWPFLGPPLRPEAHMAYAGHIPSAAVTYNGLAPKMRAMTGQLLPPRPPPQRRGLPPPPQPPLPPQPQPQQPPLSATAQPVGQHQGGHAQGTPNLITSKMAAMQCIHDQAVRPLVNVTQDQILNINRDQIQSEHALKNVT